ncbi:MAG: YggS family pyridoxal phosphate-dependent enzyme [Cytophagales bacterium CG12_big_fil_rev_8_21_14_0_65_40_12]|nr:MAG: YggS family pyridoxal phosphate-dependent enzyme [Cytophagales bacterium CG12_big_fil_rev_8_21_14_0_65_40_12]PIW05024.1 MAG: YggS family pyridoxal phosphate-dependent enzyme [Cytophagales bacterium CG17_big_fil_post_rev_8_21_14_2_50_40_13]
MSIENNIKFYTEKIRSYGAQLIAVSKTKPNEDLLQAYAVGQRDFGENKVQDMTAKWETLPKDIRWHMIGHLQRNKVKYIAPYVHLIHGVDSERLLVEINKQAEKNERVIPCLLQVFIAQEETKFGFSEEELMAFLNSEEFESLKNIKIIGLMGMASNTENMARVKAEFEGLKSLFDKIKADIKAENIAMKELSMGMTNDYIEACEAGSTMVRIGSAIFGERNY